MIARLTPLQRRFAALAIAAALVALAYAGLARPLVAVHGYYDERISTLEHQLQQYRRSAKERESLERLLAERKRADAARQYYLGERNAALASAELQALVKRALEQARAELVSTQVASGQRPNEVTVKAQVRGDVRSVQRLLHALESGQPLLFVNNLSITTSPAARTVRAPAPPSGKDLLVNFDLTGYTRERSP